MTTGLALLLLRGALRCFPPAFRQRFADAMLDTFAERLAERRRHGRFAGVPYTARTLANVVVSGLRERSRPSPVRAIAIPPPTRLTAGTRLLIAAGDARLAVRMLRRSPGFSMVAVLTLALGVGANTAIFSVVHGVLLKPLPYAEPQGLVTVDARWAGVQDAVGSMSYPDLADLEREAPSLASLVGVNASRSTLTGLGEPVVLDVIRVTKGLLETFRAAPVLGRDIRADEFGPTGPRVVLAGYGFWQTRLAGRPDAVGEAIALDGVPYEIVGVAPAGFDYPDGAALWIPRRLDLEGCGRGCHTMTGVGRLAPGATLGSVRVDADRIARALEAAYPETNTHKGFLVRSLQDRIVGDVRQGLLLLLGAVGLVVLIACANVANLLLVRATRRTGEVAIRTALGASRTRLVTQVLVESAVLALLGGLAGLAVAAGTLAWLVTVAPSLPRLETIAIDGTVLLFTLGTLIVVTLLFGTAPALALMRTPVRHGLARSTPGSGGQSPGRRRLRSALVAFETAMAVLLLVAAGLLLRSFVSLYAVDLGFEARHLTRFSLTLPVQYDTLDRIRAFYRTLEERVRLLPGVEAAGSVWGPPLGRGHATGTVLVEGRPEPRPGDEREAAVHPVGPGWLETMGIAVVRGRGLTAADDVGPEPVALVNETFARQNFPAEDPLGRRARLTVDLGYGSPTWRIVGVVRDVRTRAIDEEPEPQMYVPHGLYGPEDLTVTLRSRTGVSILPAVREIVRELDSSVPMYRVETVQDAIDRDIAPTRFHLMLIATFAGLAAVLAAVGIHGVVAFAATCRIREMGLRFALGASRAHVLRLVLAQGLAPAALGVAGGLVGAYFASRLMEAILFGVDPRDPLLFLGSSALLLLVATVATLAPAFRASRIDPARALRLD